MVITSLENNRIKDLVKLQTKKYRDNTNTFLVEGYHLVEETYKSNILKEVFALEGTSIDFDIPITYVSSEVMKKITTTDTYCDIVGLCEKKNSSEIIGNKILLLDDIQDPGNLGTIIRSSVAFNVDTIVLSLNTVDLYNPKVLRSTQGLFCHINIINMDLVEAIDELKARNITVYGTNVDGGKVVQDLELDGKYAIIVGNEGKGVRKEILDKCDEYFYIPMNSTCESLNVGVATSIILYELNK